MFDYKARNASGEMTTGTIEANDQANAAQILAGRKFIPVEIKESASAKQSVALQDLDIFQPKVQLDDLVIFARQMYSLTKSGIPILRAVNGLAETSNSKRMADTLHDVADQLERGRTISSALNAHPKIFNQLFVSIVHVGENTGQLDTAFLQLAGYLEREQETRKQIKSATRYPMFVIFFLVVALVVMNIFVIPVFAGMFEKFGAELPAMTKFLIGMSSFFLNYWPHMLVALIGMFFAVRYYVNTDIGRYKWDRTKLRMPIVGDIFERTLLGRFCRSFSMMLLAGVPLPNALSLVSDAVDNAFMGDAILNMKRNIERGESLSRVAQGSNLFTPLVLQMINVGEETGRVDELLTEVAEFYEREVDYDLKSLTAKIEPILITVVAVMVLVLALGIFTPMWEMMSAVKG